MSADKISALATFEAMRRRENLPLAQENEAIAAFVELIEAAQPFATFHCSDPTMTIGTVGIPRLRAALARVGGAP